MLVQPLDDGQVDLWLVRFERELDPPLLAAYRALLPGEERKEAERFSSEEARTQFLLGRALLRIVLSHYVGEDPRVWVFRRSAHGKPVVAGPAPLPLEFNLSHTRGLAACAVAMARNVGVDVEALRSSPDHLLLARRFFAPAELAALEALPPQRQPDAFFRFWTLKEAFVKAQGKGLSVPLDSFAFSLAADRPPQVSFPSSGRDDPDPWQFAQLTLGGRFQIAVAVRFPSSRGLSLRLLETLPLRWQTGGRVLPQNATNRWLL